MVRTDPRRAGAVRRYHTWPTIQTQTVAEASWNVTRILVQIWPDAPAQAITHALLNDCGEIRSGDLPFPIKRDNPVLKAEIVRIEEESLHEQMIGALAAAPGDDIWRRRVKICDMLEMWEFGLDELTMGNQYALPIVDATVQDVYRLITEFQLPDSDVAAIQEYEKCRRAKTPERA
jgi:5'-deoxynucleotidase YfbR-like HD superfamily hydrolase